ncbi:MAG: pirin family protein [Polyangiaceae bacterium]
MPIEAILMEQARSIGTHTVRRVLPQIARRAVGPFVFLDRMGPVDILPEESFDVLPHPHIGLSTLSYLFDGVIVHRDSTGAHQRLEPGGINFMTAGRGVVHSERGPEEGRTLPLRLHGLQFWVALPLADEETSPSFEHVSAKDIPTRDISGCSLRILAGEAYGARSPLRTFSPLVLVDATMPEGATLQLPAAPELAVYVLEGTVAVEGTEQGSGHLVILGEAASTLEARTSCHVVILGGPPLDAPRYLYWNFVASSKGRLEAAKEAWRNQTSRFPPIPGDDAEFIPLPER